MTRGELVTIIFFVVAIALVSGFLAVALMFPELLPMVQWPVAAILSACVDRLGKVGGLKRERHTRRGP